MNIGVIGTGFVGSAINAFLNKWSDHHVFTYDIKDGIPADEGYQGIVMKCKMIYLCLPTPMNAEGRCHIEIVENALRLLDHHASLANKMPIVLIKSTMVPGTSQRLQSLFNSLILVTNPEFLTERTAYNDFKNASRHVLGIIDPENNPIKSILANYHTELWGHAECLFVTPTEAELIKYVTNSYFTVKVTFANHMYQLCQTLGIEYEQWIKNAIHADPRLGENHWRVPGPDGKLGYSGSCFCKDLSGMITLFNDNEFDAVLLETAREYNNKVRPERDWEQLKGRAVIDEESECQS